ncbi:MAG: lipoprotein insertase outer membrane protein LolB [Pseudomonadota bacterium]
MPGPRAWACALLAATVEACQLWPAQPAPAAWRSQAHAWERTTHWEANGRFAVRYGSTSEQGTLTWQQQGTHYTLLLSSPWAQGGIALEVSPRGAQLRSADGQRRYADDPEALLTQYIGWPLPVTALGYWLRALPQPGHSYRAHWDAQDRLQHLSQAGWEITYTRYAADTLRPDKLVLTHADLEARIVLDEWAVPTPQPYP